MSSTTHANYLADLGDLLKREALRAKIQASEEVGKSDHQFALGRLMAYYEVVSLMLQQAEAFGIAASDICLQDFDPDRELLTDSTEP